MTGLLDFDDAGDCCDGGVYGISLRLRVHGGFDRRRVAQIIKGIIQVLTARIQETAPDQVTADERWVCVGSSGRNSTDRCTASESRRAVAVQVVA